MTRPLIASLPAGGAFAALLLLAGTAAPAGDFSDPRPYDGKAARALRASIESSRQSGGGAIAGTMYYTLGDHYERYQSATNWNNAVLSGNTIILNGDNNSVTLTTDGSTVTQSTTGSCQNTSNTFLNSGGTAGAPGSCGGAE